MKKPYITPTTSFFTDVLDTLLDVVSQGVTSDDYNIGYGGLDYDGTKVAGSRSSDFLWDEDF